MSSDEEEQFDEMDWDDSDSEGQVEEGGDDEDDSSLDDDDDEDDSSLDDDDDEDDSSLDDDDDEEEEDEDDEEDPTPFRVEFAQCHGNRDVYWKWDGTASIPERMDGMWISGVIDSNDIIFSSLLNLLRNNPRQWSEIIIYGAEVSTTTPEFLEILEATFTKTDMLRLSGCMNDTEAFSCLNRSFRLHGGFKKLELMYADRPMRKDEAETLSHGLSTATVLEELSLLQGNLTSIGVAPALIQGLRACQSLLTLDIEWCRFEPGVLSQLFSALQYHPKLTKLKFGSSYKILEQEMDVLSEWLGRDDCKLQKLVIRQHNFPTYGQLPEFSDLHLATPNVSLKELTIFRGGLDAMFVHSLLSKFSSLVSLDLSENNIDDLSPICDHFSHSPTKLVSLDLSGNKISDLAPLDRLIYGSSATLQTLILNNNQIGVTDILHFARKMSEVKTLKMLVIAYNPFLESQVCTRAFVHALEENTSLEKIYAYVYGTPRSLKERMGEITTLNRSLNSL